MKVFLKILQNSQENTCARVPFLIKLLAKKEAQIQVSFLEFCEIFKNTFLIDINLSKFLLFCILISETESETGC